MEAFWKNEDAVKQLKTYLQADDSDFDPDEEDMYGNEEIVAQSRSTPTLFSRNIEINEPVETPPPLMPRKYNLSLPRGPNANIKNHIYYNEGQSTCTNISKLLTKEIPSGALNLKKLDQYGQQSKYPKHTDGRNLPPPLHNKDHENEDQAPNKSPMERSLPPLPKFKSGVSSTSFEFHAANKVNVDEITTEVNQSSSTKSFEER